MSVSHDAIARNGLHRPTVDEVLSRLDGVSGGNGKWQARCPAHDDSRASLSISTGDDGRILMHDHAGCTFSDVCEALGYSASQLMPARSNGHAATNGEAAATKAKKKPPQYGTPDAAARSYGHGVPAMVWPYHAATGEEVARVLRWDTPEGKVIRPIAMIDGLWRCCAMPTPRPLYRLPDVLAADRVCVCEGEKAADALRSVGLVATTCAGGAESADKADWSPLAGKNVVIWPDNDEPGEKYCSDVCAALCALTPPATVRIIRPDGLPAGGDAADWLDQRDATDPDELRQQLSALADAAPVFARPAASSIRPAARPRLAPGTLVRARDRDNYGTVVQDHGDTCTVHFVSPSGDAADVDFAPSDLCLADSRPVVESYVPNVRTIGDLIASHPHLRPPVIDGLLRRGEVGNIISKSKIGKSWFAYSLAWSIITGRELFGQFKCSPGDVLLIDNELHEQLIPFRVRTVAAAMGIQIIDVQDRFHVESLRGRNVDLFQLAPLLNESIRGRYQLIILDAMYRLYPNGMDENSNSDVTQFYNQLDRFAAETDTAILCIHHATKGGQSDKDVTDVGAGAGAMSRAADSHLILRPHQDEDCVVLQAAVRSFPPVDPLVLQWMFPVWSPATHLDPAALKTPKSARTEDERKQKLEENRRKVHDYLRQPGIRETGASATNIRDHTSVRSGLGQVLDSLVLDKNLIPCDVVHGGNKSVCKGWKINPEN